MSRTARGFTLIEILLATALLVGGLALAFATVRSAMAISQRGERMAAQNERMRAVEGLLRRQLSMALLLPTLPPDPTRDPVYFIGEPQRMLFVADVPGYLGRGGPYAHELQVRSVRGGQQLALALTLLQNGEAIEEDPPRAPEMLADQLRSVTFRYRGIDARTGEPTAWLPQWDDTRRLPTLVSIEVVPAQGPAWPPMVAALSQHRGVRP